MPDEQGETCRCGHARDEHSGRWKGNVVGICYPCSDLCRPEDIPHACRHDFAPTAIESEGQG